MRRSRFASSIRKIRYTKEGEEAKVSRAFSVNTRRAENLTGKMPLSAMREGSFIKASCWLVHATVDFRMLALVSAAVVVLATSVSGQASFKCPTKNGYYPDKEQCDLYYECRRGVPSQKLCDDGMAFIWANNPLYGKCDVITNVDCSDRPYLQQAKTTLHCPRANGYYRHEKWPQVCDEFYQCDKGKVKLLKCQAGLAFDPITSGCQWAAKVEGCEYLTDKLPKPPGHAEPQYDDDYEDEAQPPPKAPSKPASIPQSQAGRKPQ